MQCKWEKAWVGPCREEADESGFCQEHKGIECCSCGEQATHDCAQTGQFVCGAFLCDDCEHTIFPEGHNGGIGFNAQPCPPGMKRHCKKTEQKYLPWYLRKQRPKQQPLTIEKIKAKAQEFVYERDIEGSDKNLIRDFLLFLEEEQKEKEGVG